MYADPALDTDLPPSAQRFGDRSPWRLIIYGFIYWTMIVGALEPGNIVNAFGLGASPRWGQELLRILGAGLLGSVTAPAFVSLSRRFPVSYTNVWPNAVIHLLCAIVAAAVLITVAHVLAIWLLESGHRITMASLGNDLAANELLLVTGLVALSGLAHLVLARLNTVSRPLALSSNELASGQGGYAETAPDGFEPPVGAIQTVEIKVRGLTKSVPVGDIDWIEAQGNYLALHVGDSHFLLRETLAKFEARLDPVHFVRIHRRTIIAVNRVIGIEPAANGDGVVRLSNSQALRVSRLYRKALSARCRISFGQS